MGILTKAQLTNATEAKLGYFSFRDNLRESKVQNRYSAQKTIFLSHSHADLEDGSVDKAIVFLRKLGVIVYIDSNDASLPPTTDTETANKLKERIKVCDKFILLASNNSISSKWCNWELGIGDVNKYINHIALFPLADNTGYWNGAEYLTIYPRIEESNYTNGYYKVIFPDKTEKSLYEWLSA